MADRNDSTIAKNLTGKVQEVTYSANEFLGHQWVTIDGIKYAAWIDFDKMDIYPGVRVEHAPYIDFRNKPNKIKATHLVKILKK